MASGSDSRALLCLWMASKELFCDGSLLLAPYPHRNSRTLMLSCLRCSCLWPFLLRDSKPEPVKALEAEEQAKIEAGELKPSVGGMKPGWEPKRTIAITHDNSR